MKVELFPFQKKALADIRMKSAEAIGGYRRTHAPQVVSFTAPTGSGKTIIMSALIESILYGDDSYVEQPDAIVVWLSDSPQLNEQSKLKIDAKADKIRLSQCVTISEESFDCEMLEDGCIYFLNTQKLSSSAKLTKNGDSRSYTIWETLANTVREKSDRLYFIIDEAHRGMQGKEASKATTIMQKFIKGSDADGIPPMPVVIGMSATTKRFNTLVEGTSSTIYKSVVTPDEVRASGLLKDRIVITYPEEEATNNDMVILQAAADDWKEKWDHWAQYCYEQHYAYVNPILIVQVLDGKAGKLTATDLNDCLSKIEERASIKFDAGQVVHTFGATTSSLTANGLEVPYVEPSQIADNRNIRVVFFKENLSTGWDCPRAETMMSFRHAKDATYIAQLLGRMVRTPMQMHIQVDDVLNDVHLYLPYFNEDTVKDVVEALQSSEGGDIPTEIYGESSSAKRFETLTVRTKHKSSQPTAGQTAFNFSDAPSNEQATDIPQELDSETADTSSNNIDKTEHEPSNNVSNPSVAKLRSAAEGTLNEASKTPRTVAAAPNTNEEVSIPSDLFDREGVMKFINDSGLLTYNVRALRVSNYLTSLFNLAHLLSMANLYREAIRDVHADVVEMIHKYVEGLRENGKYDALVSEIKQFKLAVQTFDAFGETVDNYSVQDLFTTTDADIDRQFRVADIKLGRDGIGNAYGNVYATPDDMTSFKIDVILFAADQDCMNSLYSYAEDRFHSLNDRYRRYMATVDSEKLRRKYDSIVSDGDVVSKHNFRLPETIQVPHEAGGKAYRDHLFVSDTTGVAVLKLNAWEAGVIAEEEKRDDFVCWIRNPSRSPWSLCIPYMIDGETKSAYPDFIVVRKDNLLGYVIDILEPHNPDFKDNLGKAKGFAEYAKQNPGVGRIQLIRMSKDAAGNNRFKRLDMYQSAVRDKVTYANNTDELDHIFDTDGFFD